MKATGVIRKIDSLGRIVIPKEIRRNLRINDGDSLEIYIYNDELLLKKYSMLDNLGEFATKLVDSFYKLFKKSIVITDKSKIIASSKNIRSNYIDKELSISIKELISNRIEYNNSLNIIIGSEKENIYFLPIVSSYDVLGSIILIDNNISDIDKNYIKLLNTFLLKNIEE